MPQYHEFDQQKLNQALTAAKQHPAAEALRSGSTPATLTAPNHLVLRSECVSLTVENGQVCLNLPLGIGQVCLPIPASFPNGTAAQACLDICTTWGFPTGVRVTVSIAGIQVVNQTFGHC